MPTLNAIEKAAGRLTALLQDLPDVPERSHALEHVKAVTIYASAALTTPDEAPAPSGEPESREH